MGSRGGKGQRLWIVSGRVEVAEIVGREWGRRSRDCGERVVRGRDCGGVGVEAGRKAAGGKSGGGAEGNRASPIHLAS